MIESEFYKKGSEKFGRYAFDINKTLVGGERPDFLGLLKRNIDKGARVLDLGCGSGELAFEAGPYFREVIGIDPFEKYVLGTEGRFNVKFLVADGLKLPFRNGFFDIVYSSRGPLSFNVDFMRESLRVLRDGGLLIEETIGEKDKVELKELFGRGQNYPIQNRKIEDIANLLVRLNVAFVDYENYLYYEEYSSIGDVVTLLERAPIIPDFDESEIIVLEGLDDLVLSSHRIHWVGRKE